MPLAVEADMGHMAFQDCTRHILYRSTSGIAERLAPLQSAAKPHGSQPVVCVQNGKAFFLRFISPGVSILKVSNTEPTGGRFENGEHVTFLILEVAQLERLRSPIPSREINMRTAKSWSRTTVTSILSSMSGRRQAKLA